MSEISQELAESIFNTETYKAVESLFKTKDKSAGLYLDPIIKSKRT